MSDRRNIAAASRNIVLVPLSKLKKSPKNVRQVPHTKADLQALSASIQCRRGPPSRAIASRQAQGNQARRADLLHPRHRTQRDRC